MREIREKAWKAACVLDRAPWCYIAFAVFTMIFMAACGLALNSVVPAYQ